MWVAPEETFAKSLLSFAILAQWVSPAEFQMLGTSELSSTVLVRTFRFYANHSDLREHIQPTNHAKMVDARMVCYTCVRSFL